MSDPILPQLNNLLADWKQVRDTLAADIARDRREGLTRAPEAGEIGVAALDGCIKSLEAVLVEA